jgi:hypothetical protein
MAFIQGLTGPMRRVPADEEPPFDFWPYVAIIPEEHFEGHDFSGGRVEWVYEDAAGRYQLVHIDGERKNVYLVIVLDKEQRRVHGHLVLDLNKEYGNEGA